MDKIVKIITVTLNSGIICPGCDLVDTGAAVQDAVLAAGVSCMIPFKMLTIKNMLKLTGGK